ncbi:MAG TPA: FAD-dependent oxidoreductase, partial [Chitinophagales bacterium]|nr:FAD-dependent oxidoreductase [Chitinophagales bacterium]
CWSSQYFEPADGLPYIGHLPGNPPNVWVATGFGGNGIIYGTASALILADLICNGSSEYQQLFNPARVKPVAGFQNFVKEAADVVGVFVGKAFATDEIDNLVQLAKGDARVVKYDGQTIALYKDEAGKLHGVNPSCPHIKCTVSWNTAEKSWDCPCHGSRFSYTGRLLTGPARKDLENIKIQDNIR